MAMTTHWSMDATNRRPMPLGFVEGNDLCQVFGTARLPDICDLFDMSVRFVVALVPNCFSCMDMCFVKQQLHYVPGN